MSVIKKLKLRRLLLFGVLVTILLCPLVVQADVSEDNGIHHSDTHLDDGTQREKGKVYDGNTPWDQENVGWFQHNKQISPGSTARWGTNHWVITPKKIENYTIPIGIGESKNANATIVRECWISNGWQYVDAIYKFSRRDVVMWIGKYKQLGEIEVNNDGYLTVYASPVIDVTYYSNGTPTSTKTVYSLADWKAAAPWYDPTTFDEYYNKPLSMAVEGKVEVQYQTLTKGNGYEAGTPIKDTKGVVLGKPYSFNWLSKQPYTEAGLQESIKGIAGDSENTKWVLTGIKVEKPDDMKLGTAGTLYLSVENGNIVRPDDTYSITTDTLSDLSEHSTNGYKFTKEKESDVYKLLKDQSFRLSAGTTKITYYYSELKTEINVHFVAKFDGLPEGENTEYRGNIVVNAGNVLVPSRYRLEGEDKKETLGEKNDEIVEKPNRLPRTISKGKQTWQLCSANFGIAAPGYKKGVYHASLPNLLWGPNGAQKYIFYNYCNTDATTRGKNIDTNHAIKASNAEQDLVYVGHYELYVPQIELYYYKDANGKYTLIKTTSKGEGITDETSGYNYNVYSKTKPNSVTHKVNTLLEGVKIDDEEKDLILTRSYACNNLKAVNVVKDYNGARKNCWTKKRPPDYYSSNRKTRYNINVSKAYDEYVDLKKTTRETTCAVNQSPTIFVYIYEGGPKLTVQSYYKTGSTAIGEVLYEFTSGIGKFRVTIGGKRREYKCATTVEYPLGTKEVLTKEVWAQDGVDKKGSGYIWRKGYQLSWSDSIITNDKAMVYALMGHLPTSKLRFTKSILENDVRNEFNDDVKIPYVNENPEKIRFKNGEALLVKFYGDPRKVYWTVAYANTERDENGKKAVEDSISVYKRISDPKKNVSSPFPNDSKFRSPFEEHLMYKESALKEEAWTLTNVV